MIDGLFRAAYTTMAEKVWAESPQTHVITHGYAHAIPDGRAVINLPLGFHFVGSAKPAFCKKDILDMTVATGIVVNPTNCSAEATETTLTSTLGATQSLSSPFQVSNCSALKFKPMFAAKTSGKTSKQVGCEH